MTPAEQKERDRLDKLAGETLLTIANREADRIEALNAEISALLSQNGKLREALEDARGFTFYGKTVEQCRMEFIEPIILRALTRARISTPSPSQDTEDAELRHIPKSHVGGTVKDAFDRLFAYLDYV